MLSKICANMVYTCTETAKVESVQSCENNKWHCGQTTAQKHGKFKHQIRRHLKQK